MQGTDKQTRRQIKTFDRQETDKKTNKQRGRRQRNIKKQQCITKGTDKKTYKQTGRRQMSTYKEKL
jgi:hypothetical protein